MIQSRAVDPNKRATPHYFVKTLALALPAFMLGLQISAWIFFLPGAMQGHCDFRHLYAAAYMVRTGHRAELYDYGVEQKFQDRLVSPEQIALPFNHLAYEALLFLPYSYASYRVAYFLFLISNVILLAIVIRLFRPWTQNLRDVFWWFPAALFVTFLAVPAALMQGQDSVVLLLLFATGFVLLNREELFRPGFLVGLGLFKFQVVIPVVLLFLLWRKWRFVAGFLTASALVTAISFWLAGLPQMTAYAHSLMSMSVKETALDQVRFAIYPIRMPNLRGLVYVLTASWLPRFWVQATTGFASLMVFLWTAYAGRRRSLVQQFLLAIVMAVLLSYHIYIHDLSLLLIPLAIILDKGFLGIPTSNLIQNAAAVLTFSIPAIIGLSSINPFIISVPIVLFLFALGTKSSRVFRVDALVSE